MGIGQLEDELKNLSAADLRRLALRSWAAFVQKERVAPEEHGCDESDPALLAAVDEAVRRTDQAGDSGMSGDDVRAKINKWIRK